MYVSNILLILIKRSSRYIRYILYGCIKLFTVYMYTLLCNNILNYYFLTIKNFYISQIMLFLLNMYIIFYVINLISLQYIIKKTFDNQITFTSLPYMIYYIIKFSKFKNVYYGLVLALTGIPPFLLFFIKFNFLIEVFSKFGFILFYIIFLILFLHMLFYIQTFYLKNIDFDLQYVSLKKQKVNFSEIFIINYFLSIFYLSIFFFPDISSSLALMFI